MAKRRHTPAENPLKRDLAASIAKRPTPSPAPSTVEPEATPPTQAESSVDVSVAAPAEPPASTPRPPQPKKRAEWNSSSKVTMKTRFIPEEAKENADLTNVLGRLMGGSKVSESHVTRALWSLARRAEESMNEHAAKAPKMPRPSHGDRLATGEYEDAIADFILLALKRTRKEG